MPGSVVDRLCLGKFSPFFLGSVHTQSYERDFLVPKPQSWVDIAWSFEDANTFGLVMVGKINDSPGFPLPCVPSRTIAVPRWWLCASLYRSFRRHHLRGGQPHQSHKYQHRLHAPSWTLLLPVALRRFSAHRVIYLFACKQQCHALHEATARRLNASMPE
jgi:hypothetical protein